jgi:hypothetical protein
MHDAAKRARAPRKWRGGRRLCRILLAAGSVQQKEALMRTRIKEIRVLSRDEIIPTYRIPALVRVVSGSVVLIDRCANHDHRPPYLQATTLALP